MTQAQVVPFVAPPVHVDDIPCAINPVQACDLKQILLMTPADRRLDVAVAFCGLTGFNDVCTRAGLVTETTAYRDTCYRWLHKYTRFPLGAAFRVARVFGVPADILLEWWV